MKVEVTIKDSLKGIFPDIEERMKNKISKYASKKGYTKLTYKDIIGDKHIFEFTQ